MPSFLAKITPPTVRNALARKQLFERLDQEHDRRLIWICAPAGYGKTTAIVSYLRARAIAPIWYQCDESDGDIGAVFYYLGQAFQQLVDQPLAPEFSPEHLAAIA
jgi:LuxR family maltose regulon positive regulatory protein